MDLFGMAADSRQRLEARFVEARTAAGEAATAAVDRFAATVERDGRVSINTRPWVCSQLLCNGCYQNIHEWAAEQAGLCERPAAEILRERLRDFYGPRIAFDEAFTDGRQFRYGALNIGGAGPLGYGQFCVVLRPDITERGPQVAFLRGDSLKTYIITRPDGHRVNEGAIREDATPYTHRHHLAVVKHITRIAETSEAKWAIMLCSDGDLIEAVILGTISLDTLDRVRVHEGEYVKLYDLAFGDFGRKLGAAERALANDFVEILKRVRDLPMTLERIIDA